MNETSAREWLVKSWHHLSSAKILYEVNHYTDIIAVEIHYSVEISLKAILAFENSKIVKTHDLIGIYKNIKHRLDFTEVELSYLDIISEYHIGESYPAHYRKLPPREEIKEVLDFTNSIFERVSYLLNIPIDEIKAQ